MENPFLLQPYVFFSLFRNVKEEMSNGLSQPAKITSFPKPDNDTYEAQCALCTPSKKFFFQGKHE
ncbi:MAG: hypothetical protein D3910_01070 [Candidatus Electrothrix sp. ATG2]|nr:hypothetical protein [Candidatus Electrothrix sp. ATG2]